MRSGGLIVLFFLGWMAWSLMDYALAKPRPPQALPTVGYILGYPIAMWVLFENRPVSPLVVVPVIMAGLPWMFAGAHLSGVLKDPSREREGEFIGMPFEIWAKGFLIAIAVGAFGASR